MKIKMSFFMNLFNIKYFSLLLTAINILTWIPTAASFDPCIFLGNCNLAKINLNKIIGDSVNIVTNNNNNNNDNNANARNDPGEAPVYVDGKWIESSTLKTDQIYLFPEDAPSMSWYDAEKYCADKGAFLAEPYTEEESNFLRDQANRLPNTNWWLGLREFEKCKCIAVGRSSTEIEAFIDQHSPDQHDEHVEKSTNNGLGLTTCPSNFQKRCDGREWRWGFSGQRMTYNYWNTKSGEPNGNNEHCVTMWFKSDNQRWGDWHCATTVDSPNQNSGFKPVCQKTKNTGGNSRNPDGDDYECEDDDYYCNEDEDDHDHNGNLEDSTAKCVATDTKYKFGHDNVITKIEGIPNFNQCQLKCAEVSECKYWMWKGNKPSKKCVLARNVKQGNFIKNKPGVVSGTMLNGCKPNTNTDHSSNLQREYCVEYGATYNGGNQISVLKNIDNAELCREKCLETGGCSYYTFSAKINKRGRKKKKCILKSAASLEELQVTKKKHSMAGSVAGRCAEIELSDNNVCHCIKISKPTSNSQNANGRSSIVGRINPNTQVEEFFVGKDGSVDQETFFDTTWTHSDILGEGLQLNDNIKCRKGNVKRCTSNLNPNQEYTRGEYCVDYNVRYDEGDEFKVIDRVSTAQECRFECLATQRSDGCRFYSWISSNQKCYLITDELWIPVIEKDAVSGTLDGLCKTQSFGQLGECECQKIEVYDEYEDEYPDLVSTGLIDVRSGASSGCPEDQGKRCYARVAVTTTSQSSDLRYSLTRLLPDTVNSDAIHFG